MTNKSLIIITGLVLIIIVLVISYIIKKPAQIPVPTTNYRTGYQVYANEKTKNSYIKGYKGENRKENVVIYVSYDYPEIPEYGEFALKKMEEYCKYHDYKFEIRNHTDSEDPISPYWIRVKDMKNLLQREKENSIIMYVDLDVIINPKYFKTSIVDLIDSLDYNTGKPWDIYAAIDPAYAEMNAGIIIVKNTEWTRKYVDLWYMNYPKGFWTKNNTDNKWICDNCVWAGDNYEQGMLNRLYQRNIYDAKDHILPIDDTVMGNWKIESDAIIYHFMGQPNILQLFKTLYPTFEDVI